MTRGVTLEPGTIVVLSLDGTLVFVEDLQSTFAAVVALPEQPTQRADDRVFTPGKVGVKRISPFSTFDRIVPRDQLSARNAHFLDTYEDLRDKHGNHYVARTPEEEAAMSVTKVQPESRGSGRRAQKRAAARQQKCATCGEQPGHPTHPSDHAFVPPADASGQPEDTAKRQPRTATSSAVGRYTLVNEDLTAARAQPRGDKYNVGNRSHRVVLALASLPEKTGSLDDVIAALCADGQTPPSNPEKITRRTLNQLATEEFGSCVTRA